MKMIETGDQNMNIKKVTLKDIAEATGFSVNTVSHALNDKDDISAETKRIVHNKARELGYIRNTMAGALRSRKTNTIAVIIGDISNPYWGIMVKLIEIYARQHQYVSYIISTEEDPQMEETAVMSALERNVDGIILCPCQKNDNSVKMLKKLDFPFVLIGRYFDDIPCNYIASDDRTGGYLATKHLLDKGHSQVLFLNGPSYISSARLRLMGYLDALKERGIPYDPRLVKEVSITGDSSYFAGSFSRGQLNFSAIFAFSDIIAWEAIHTMKKLHLPAFENIEVVGFDNLQSNLLLPYSLTSVGYNKPKMAQLAVETLLKAIDGEISSYVKIILDTELILRS